jgi:hypothetical protein
MELTSERKFWICIGLGGALLIAIFIMAMVMSGNANVEEDQWAVNLLSLNSYQARKQQVPSDDSLKDWVGYRKWLKMEADDKLAQHFVDARILLEQPFDEGSANGDSSLSPSLFKILYRELAKSDRDWLKRHSSDMRLEESAVRVPDYTWLKANSIEKPDPNDYLDIRRKYWAHHYIYRMFLNGRVKVVRRLQSGKTVQLNDINPDFDGLHMSASVLVRPKDVDDLLKELQRVPVTKSERGDHSPGKLNSPILLLRRLHVRPYRGEDAKGRLCLVDLEACFLIYRGDAKKKEKKS